MAKTTTAALPRLKQAYLDTFVSELQKELELKNVNQVPKLEKIVLNVGLGRSKDDKQMFEVAANTLTKITGQKPVETYAKVSIATFKLREGNKIGLKVTLRGDRMYEFMDRLINIVMPRLRDFHGVSGKAFDKQGNYSMGVSEQIIFPEINYDQIDAIRGMDITISTTARNAEEGRALLEAFSFPFKK